MTDFDILQDSNLIQMCQFRCVAVAFRTQIETFPARQNQAASADLTDVQRKSNFLCTYARLVKIRRECGWIRADKPARAMTKFPLRRNNLRGVCERLQGAPNTAYRTRTCDPRITN